MIELLFWLIAFGLFFIGGFLVASFITYSIIYFVLKKTGALPEIREKDRSYPNKWLVTGIVAGFLFNNIPVFLVVLWQLGVL